jgi:CBS domain containing-hemolysin-like protein
MDLQPIPGYDGVQWNSPGYPVDAEIVAVLLCLIGSGFFSGSETALTSLPVTRLEALRQRSGRLARAGLDRWANAPQSFLITILVGNNLVNVLASALATSIAYRVSADGGLAMVVGVMTLGILIFGEITPKTLAQQHAEWIAAKVAPVLYILDVVLRPMNAVLGLLSKLLSRGGGPELPVTEEDLVFMLRLAHRHAHLPRDSRIMIESVLRYQRAVAREVMVPRPMVTTVERSWSFQTLQQEIVNTPHSRFPVVDGSPDDIVGVLHAKHLLRLVSDDSWLGLVVPAVFIPESRSLPDLLQDFRRSGQHVALVLDEFGGLSGLVTLEDVLELVVGEIEDEFDLDHTSAVEAVDGGWRVAGHLSLRRLEAIIHRSLEEIGDIDSVGGLIAHLADDDVAVGSTVQWNNLEFTVEDADSGRPTQVIVRPVKSQEQGVKG